jgi:hypothetical protein
MAKKYAPRAGTNGFSRSAIDTLCIEFDVSTELAGCLVGRTEQETENRIALFKGYLKDLLTKKRMWERYDFIPKAN